LGEEILAHLIIWITAFIAKTGYAGVFLLMTLESACIPVPSEAVMPFAGSLIITDPGRGFNIYLLTVIGALANVAGSALSYWVGACGGRKFINRYGKYFLIREADVERADRFFKKHGDAAAFFSRMLPIVRTYISLPAGISGMPFLQFVAYTFAGALPFCLLLAWAGVKLGKHWQQVHLWLDKANVGVSAVLIVLLGLWLWHRLKPEAPKRSDNIATQP
jgi:membrane protein DedA with SNARE-associated domain